MSVTGRVYTNFKAGLHSGYPLCCTTFYSLFLLNQVNKNRYVDWERKNYSPILPLYMGAPHIMCPWCVMTCHRPITRLDESVGDCLKVTLASALGTWLKWKFMSYDRQIEHNQKVER